jgi:hypothetical protein
MLVLAPGAVEPEQWAQLSIQQRVIIRVPIGPRGAARAKAPPEPREDEEWEEKKGPKCVALRSIRSAAIVTPDGIDLILADEHRYRAKLERGCRSIGFYSGFYVEPQADRSLCAGRDILRARSGLSCAIASFKRLVEAD